MRNRRLGLEIWSLSRRIGIPPRAVNWEARVGIQRPGTEDLGMNIKGSGAGERRTQNTGSGPGSLWPAIKDYSLKSWKAKGLGRGVGG